MSYSSDKSFVILLLILFVITLSIALSSITSLENNNTKLERQVKQLKASICIEYVVMNSDTLRVIQTLKITGKDTLRSQYFSKQLYPNP